MISAAHNTTFHHMQIVKLFGNVAKSGMGFVPKVSGIDAFAA